MKVTVRNLGVIREEATIDLKPLTIFIGPNNAGKTWLAYAIAGILGSYGLNAYAQAYIEKQVPNTYASLNEAIELVLAEGNATIDLHQFADDYGEMYFNNVADFARNWMSRFLSTQVVHYDNMDISLSLEEAKTQFLNRISQYSQRSGVAIGPKGSLLTIRKRRDENKLYAYTSTELQDAEGQEEQIGEKIPLEEVRERLVTFVFRALHRSLYPQILVFPTERTTLVAARFSGRIAERQSPQISKKAIEALEVLAKELSISAFAEPNSAVRETIWPVSHFLSMLNNIFKSGAIQREERGKSANSNSTIKKYIEFAEVLEKQILAGSVDFSAPEPDPRREVLFQPMQDVHIEIPIASSMVKELSPLVLYLRHLAKPGELVIIDEPEMNLHPEAQTKIIEFLAMLVNAGLNILITTHSPYITDHLTNLIKANESEEKETIRNEFYLKRTDAFISKDKVSIYGFSEDTVRNVLDEDGMFNWNTFGSVSEHIADIYFKL